MERARNKFNFFTSEFSEKKKKNAANAESGNANTNTAEQPPNQILFLTNLPEETNEMMLSMVSERNF